MLLELQLTSPMNLLMLIMSADVAEAKLREKSTREDKSLCECADGPECASTVIKDSVDFIFSVYMVSFR